MTSKHDNFEQTEDSINMAKTSFKSNEKVWVLEFMKLNVDGADTWLRSTHQAGS